MNVFLIRITIRIIYDIIISQAARQTYQSIVGNRKIVV